MPHLLFPAPLRFFSHHPLHSQKHSLTMDPTPQTHHYSPPQSTPFDEYLIAEILLKLPIKPLFRFKSVSKTWLSLISNPHFSNNHTLQNPNSLPSGLFLRNSPTQLQFLSLNSPRRPVDSPDAFVSDPSGIKILQSCHGLIFCSTLHKIGTTRSYHVCNPTTKQFAMLPRHLDCSASSNSVLGLCLVFEPRKSCHYKVVCVRSMFNSVYYYQIELYCSEAREWRVCGSPFSAAYDMVFHNGVYWNGMVYWISPTLNTLCFDVDAECFVAMPSFPFKHSPATRRSSYFGVSNERLQAIEVHGHGGLQFNVFEMGRDGLKWFLKYEVDLSGIVAEFPGMVRSYLDPTDSNYYAFVILSVVEEENEEDSFLLLHIPGKIIAYNFKTGTVKEIHELGSNGNKSSLQFGWLDAYQYIETLACV